MLNPPAFVGQAGPVALIDEGATYGTMEERRATASPHRKSGRDRGDHGERLSRR